MNVSIIGWYGTETLGDRAILDGIVTIFCEAYNFVEFSIGSLYPFVTERTLLEDEKFYKKNSPNCSFKIFDIKVKAITKQNIEKANIVLMGGGPIMDINDIKLIINAFKFARKKKIRTMLFGCGLGPLNTEFGKKQAYKLLKLTDDIIWRDNLSQKICLDLFGAFKTTVLKDPAIISVMRYKENNSRKTQNYVSINLRRFTSEYGKSKDISKESIQTLLQEVSKLKIAEEIHLVPNHSFYIGGDDREYYAEITQNLKMPGLKVYYKPPTLEQVYQEYANACGCIGMRYHTIVFQTILCGNNLIIDYTNPKKGKIKGFLQECTTDKKYVTRYTNIQEIGISAVTTKVVELDQKVELEFKLNSKNCINEYLHILKQPDIGRIY